MMSRFVTKGRDEGSEVFISATTANVSIGAKSVKNSAPRVFRKPS
jgi:hypothetical protein